MNKRKLIIMLFSLLIISFIAMILFYFYKSNKDKSNKEKENAEISIKVNDIYEKYKSYIDGEKVNNSDTLSIYFNNNIETHEKINSMKIESLSIEDIKNPTKSYEQILNVEKDINLLKYEDIDNFIDKNLSQKEKDEILKIYSESIITKSINDDEKQKENLLYKNNVKKDFINFLKENNNDYYVYQNKIIYSNEKFATSFKKYNTGFSLVSEISLGKKIPILMYHAVDDNAWGDTSLFVNVKDFEMQMKYLSDNGYTSLFLSEIDKADEYEKPIIITFDDGYKNVYDNAYPILKKYNLKSCFYIITRWMDGDTYVTSDMVKEMDNSGIVEIGSHTLTHNKLGQNSYEKQYEELTLSKKDLETLLSKNINTIAYPYGSYNKDTIAITKENYDYAVTVNPGFNYSNNLSSKALNRFKVGRNMNINSFINMIGGNNE